MRVPVAVLHTAYVPSSGIQWSLAALVPAASCGVLPFSAYEKRCRSRGTHGSITSQRSNTSASNSNKGINNSNTTTGTTSITASSPRSCSWRDAESASLTPDNTSVPPGRPAHNASAHYAASSSVSCSCVSPASLRVRAAASVAGIKHPTSCRNLHVLAEGLSTLTPAVPSAKDSRSRPPVVRHARTPACLSIVGRFVDAASTVSGSIAHVPESALREVFVSALAVESTEEARGRGPSRPVAGGSPTGKIPAAAKAPLGRLFRALLRSGLLHKFGPASFRKRGNTLQEASKQQQQQLEEELGERKESETQDQHETHLRGLVPVGLRDMKQQISFNFLTEVYNEGNFYARWGAGAQMVKTAGVKGLRPPGAHLRGGIADASPKLMNYEEFRAFVQMHADAAWDRVMHRVCFISESVCYNKLVLLRLADQHSGLLPLCRTVQSDRAHCSLRDS